jgi:hypothetical protein
MTETPPEVDFIAQAEMIHEHGPAVTPPATLFFTYLKPASEFGEAESVVAKATNAEMYLRLGYTITGQQTIENLTEFNEQNATKAAPAAAKAEDTSAPAASKAKS